MKIMALMGSPGTGKTTLMRKFMEGKEEWQLTASPEFPLVSYHRCENVAILGKYEEGQLFAGTDRLSMAVQPQAVQWLKQAGSLIDTVLFEGDRLSNQSFLEHIVDNYDARIIYLEVPESERLRRYAERGSNQSEQFLRGRETKYANLTANMVLQMSTTTYRHMTSEDTEVVLNDIREWIK